MHPSLELSEFNVSFECAEPSSKGARKFGWDIILLIWGTRAATVLESSAPLLLLPVDWLRILMTMAYTAPQELLLTL